MPATKWNVYLGRAMAGVTLTDAAHRIAFIKAAAVKYRARTDAEDDALWATAASRTPHRLLRAQQKRRRASEHRRALDNAAGHRRRAKRGDALAAYRHFAKKFASELPPQKLAALKKAGSLRRATSKAYRVSKQATALRRDRAAVEEWGASRLPVMWVRLLAQRRVREGTLVPHRGRAYLIDSSRLPARSAEVAWHRDYVSPLVADLQNHLVRRGLARQRSKAAAARLRTAIHAPPGVRSAAATSVRAALAAAF